MNDSKIANVNFVNSVAKILKVVAHPVRLQVLAALKDQGPLNVTEIHKSISLDIDRSLLSHHLIKMRDNGVLKCRKEGLYIYYNMVDKKLFNILKCMESCDLVSSHSN